MPVIRRLEATVFSKGVSYFVYAGRTDRGQTPDRLHAAQIAGGGPNAESKNEPARYKSQITLAKRRIQAFTIANELIEQELDR